MLLVRFLQKDTTNRVSIYLKGFIRLAYLGSPNMAVPTLKMLRAQCLLSVRGWVPQQSQSVAEGLPGGLLESDSLQITMEDCEV